MTFGTCSDDTPFYLNGEEVLCMRCSHCKCVGLPISVCKHFKKNLRSDYQC